MFREDAEEVVGRAPHNDVRKKNLSLYKFSLGPACQLLFDTALNEIFLSIAVQGEERGYDAGNCRDKTR